MRLLMISRCPPYPLHYGDRLIIWHLARELSRQGITIDLLALTQSAEDQHTVERYQHFFGTVALFPERQRTIGMYWRRVLGAHYPSRSETAWQADVWQAIEAKRVQHTYDLVHLVGGVQVYEFAPALRNLPTVITPYESYSLYLQRAFRQQRTLRQWLTYRMARHFEKWMFTPYDRTVVLTPQDQAMLWDLNPHLAIDVIPNGIDLTHFQPMSVARDPATILFIGNYDYLPNRDAALLLAREMFPQIQAHNPQAQLQLVGNAPPPELTALASEAIIVTGRVPQVQDYLARATLFVCPLRIGAGIKNKVLEALAMGIPTVATPLSVEGIAVENGQHIMIAPLAEMASVSVALLQNASLRDQLSAQGRALIEARYSWRGVAQQYSRLYQTLIKSHQSGSVGSESAGSESGSYD